MRQSDSIVECRELVVSFGHRQVLHGLDFDIERGSVLGLVGESGSGKSTLSKVLVGATKPESGRVCVLGEDVGLLRGRVRRAFARQVQLVPQDPYSSLNPRRTIAQTLAEAFDPLRADPRPCRERIDTTLAMLGLDPEAKHRFPHEFSGGQRQRIAIGRALIVEPQLIIADEITSALDVVVQAEVISLLKRLRSELGFSMMFVTHNLAVAQDICDEVAVMRSGEIVERGATEQVFSRPREGYTRLLLDSVPGGAGFTLDTPSEGMAL